MTENPYPEYIDTEGIRRGVPHRAWNEGYNQAIEDALMIVQNQPHRYVYADIKALRKKVFE